jgi:hypothetical protein
MDGFWRSLLVPALALCLMATGGCLQVGVPELDREILPIRRLQAQSTAAEVVSLLGDPAFVRTTPWPEWYYPIRCCGWRTIPAPLLKIWLDESDQVEEWGFYHPTSGARLEIREARIEAERWLSKIHRAPKRIYLDDVLYVGRSKDDVIEDMKWWKEEFIVSSQRLTHYKDSIIVNKKAIIFYADRPSPIYIPSFYAVVTFYPDGETGFHFYGGWGGRK